jgi:quercetin dioxygenase-like cupin family protein
MERWHIPTIDAAGRREPRVLFSTPECRVVLLDLREGDGLGDHSVHERTVLEVVTGEVRVSAGGEEITCGPGTLLAFEPGERRAVSATGEARLLMLLAPWPGQGHYPAGRDVDATRTPANATAEPTG